MIYSLVTAMKPRMLVTFDKDFNPLPVSVRVGQVCGLEYYLLLMFLICFVNCYCVNITIVLQKHLLYFVGEVEFCSVEPGNP